MPEKTTANKKRYSINGKTFTWTTEEGHTVRLPMRIKLRVIRQMNNRELDASAMFEMLDAIAPGQGEALDEMDLNEFQTMFTAWQQEYQALTGATPGE